MTQPNGTGNANPAHNPNIVKSEEQVDERAGQLAKAWHSANQNKRDNLLNIALTVYYANLKQPQGAGKNYQKIAEIFALRFGQNWSESHFKKLKNIGQSYENGTLNWLLKQSSYMNATPPGVGHLYWLSTLDQKIVEQLAESGHLFPDAELAELKAAKAELRTPDTGGDEQKPYKPVITIPAKDASYYQRRMQVAQEIFDVSDDTEVFKRLLDYVADNHKDFREKEKELRERGKRQEAKREQRQQDRQDARKPLSERKNKAGQQHRQDQQADHKEPEAA